MHPHVTLLRDSYEICQAMRIAEPDVLFSALPLYHIAGYASAFLSSFQNGGTFVTADHFDPGKSLELIERERCTIIRGVETMFIMMMAHPDLDRHDLSSLRGGVCGSNAPDVLDAVYSRMGVHELTSVFGLSETASASTMTRVDDPLKTRIETQGRPLPGIEARIADPETGEPLPPGAQGEILVRGWNLMKGYYNKPKETAETIDAEGWLHTGDLGMQDAEGNLRFIDRIKDVIRVGGENVSAAEVESFLYRHPKVELVQVVAGPDLRLGQVCVAYVKARPGTACSAEEIIEFCRGKIASFKVPRHVFFVDEFPLTGSGKVQKFLLRDRAREALAPSGAA
jgi:fatty-acyl-CoA synthase